MLAQHLRKNWNLIPYVLCVRTLSMSFLSSPSSLSTSSLVIHIPGQRKNILKLRTLIDQMGFEDRCWRSKLDRAISLDLQGFTSTELRREPATIRSKISRYSWWGNVVRKTQENKKTFFFPTPQKNWKEGRSINQCPNRIHGELYHFLWPSLPWLPRTVEKYGCCNCG